MTRKISYLKNCIDEQNYKVKKRTNKIPSKARLV